MPFTQASAVLPVLLRSGQTVLLPWGRRQSQSGQLPLGGWARLESIYAGRWDRWFPQPVKLPIVRFMEEDVENQCQWFPVTAGHVIQGLVAREQYEQRVYVVTITPERVDARHLRWPRIC